MKLCDEVECVEKTLLKRRAELREADRKLLEAQSCIHTSRVQASEAQRDAAALRLRGEDKQRARELQEEVEQLRRMREEEEQMLRQVEEELRSREEELQQLDREIQTARDTLADLLSDCVEAQGHLDSLSTQLKRDEVEGARDEQHELEGVVDRKREELAELTQKVESRRTEAESCLREKSRQQTELQEVQEELSRRREERRSLQEQCKHLEARRKHADRCLSAVQVELAKQKEKHSHNQLLQQEVMRETTANQHHLNNKLSWTFDKTRNPDLHKPTFL
ncbi:centriolin [Haplochromis burtoni]|uniref:centriolin n=1 Tax=Haplochromis burtoni TaxID=8153 RepID=UPI001C2D45DE|nr:centriolin [Haplochromis burtoni]